MEYDNSDYGDKQNSRLKEHVEVDLGSEEAREVALTLVHRPDSFLYY